MRAEWEVDVVADWLGGLPEATLASDHTGEGTTTISVDVESLARAIVVSDWYSERTADAEERAAAARDLEALTVIVGSAPTRRRIARDILGSEWLAERDARMRREGAS